MNRSTYPRLRLGAFFLREAVHAALDDDEGAARDLVIEGLQTLVNRGLT